jgi:glycerol-3-phosphate acyltransferase PlsY
LYGPDFGLDDRAVALVATSAFMGHLWPVFFAFKGGKGVATAAGILFGVEPLLGAAVMGTWLIVAFFFRYSSLAALAASLFAPAYYLFGNQIAWQTSDAELLAVMVMSALLLMRHKDNIARLVSGQETKIGAKKEAPAEETDAQA